VGVELTILHLSKGQPPAPLGISKSDALLVKEVDAQSIMERYQRVIQFSNIFFNMIHLNSTEEQIIQELKHNNEFLRVTQTAEGKCCSFFLIDNIHFVLFRETSDSFGVYLVPEVSLFNVQDKTNVSRVASIITKAAILSKNNKI